MKHYYTNNENLESSPEEFIYRYREKELTFISDNGVFSKKMIDYGSRVLLDTIKIDSNKKSLLDVGCGYGTFGVSLKSVYPFLQVEMVDVNERAINLAKKNLQKNNLDAKVYMSSVYDNVFGKYDLIVTNPPIRAGKEIVTKILVEAKEHLNYKGEIWVVIQKKQGAPSAKKNLEAVFGNVTIEKKDKGYYVLKAVNWLDAE
ncbi:class I SAM-dependent methyltransferase [Thomasclavelia cocleata]|jgi:16S rRNA (guanine1207-N2)-methyltransferase|uniref:class I SAM-dependent methyltransferase n=1 Tax=Thomasclavelia cocleata TaxID=69824 RepID=UPI00242B482F|nr:class I SAM-dependent methyltransferase [Thomasclavelia cocleata]MCI9629704.1 class I SAM-dependent methyltransferase [Thomasclavelia cocleata]